MHIDRGPLDCFVVGFALLPWGLWRNHPVREAEVEDLLEAHLSEVVVDAEELRLVDVLVQLRGERAGGLAVVPERLLDDYPLRSS